MTGEHAESCQQASTDEFALVPMAVVMADVLGMRALLRSRPLEEIARTVLAPFARSGARSLTTTELGPDSTSDLTEEFILDLGFQQLPSITYALVSDSVLVLFPIDPSESDPLEAAIESIVRAASYFADVIARSSRSAIWIRGALAYGECLVGHAEGLVILGEPILEAYEWERKQEWIGGILCPSAELLMRNGEQRVPGFLTANRCIAEYCAPLKGEPSTTPKERLVIDWASGTMRLGAQPRRPQLHPSLSPDVERKVRNTLVFYDWARAR